MFFCIGPKNLLPDGLSARTLRGQDESEKGNTVFEATAKEALNRRCRRGLRTTVRATVGES